MMALQNKIILNYFIFISVVFFTSCACRNNLCKSSYQQFLYHDIENLIVFDSLNLNDDNHLFLSDQAKIIKTNKGLLITPYSKQKVKIKCIKGGKIENIIKFKVIPSFFDLRLLVSSSVGQFEFGDTIRLPINNPQGLELILVDNKYNRAVNMTIESFAFTTCNFIKERSLCNDEDTAYNCYTSKIMGTSLSADSIYSNTGNKAIIFIDHVRVGLPDGTHRTLAKRIWLEVDTVQNQFFNKSSSLFITKKTKRNGNEHNLPNITRNIRYHQSLKKTKND